MDTKELGNLGEDLACEYLVGKGFKILGRNYRISFGEIDIIAKKRFNLFTPVNNKVIHFIEVKSLAFAGDFSPEEHVNAKKQHKLKQLAEIWLQQHKLPQDQPYQIDIIAVTLKPETKIDFFENAVSG